MDAYIWPKTDCLAEKVTAAEVTNVCDTVQHATSYWGGDCGIKLAPTVDPYVAILSLLFIVLSLLYWTMNKPETQFYMI